MDLVVIEKITNIKLQLCKLGLQIPTFYAKSASLFA